MSDLLPIADGPELRLQARLLGRRHRRALLGVIGLHAAAAAAGLAGPPLLGRLVQAVVDGTTKEYVDEVVLILAVFLLVQTVLTWFARRASFVLSEKIFADLREDFMRRVLALPLSTVERAGTGDLVSRTTADVDSLARTVRFAIPETLIAAVTTVLTVAAAIWVNPLAALPCIAGAPALYVGTRWYLKRAPEAYLWERASYATLAGTVGETVEGGRTVEALGLREERVRRIDADLTEAFRAERRTLYLRTLWFPTAEFSYVIPVAASLAWGGWLVANGHASIQEVTAISLYVVQLADPVDRLVSWLDEIQVGATSFARLVGIARVPPDRTATDDEPEDERLAAEAVRYAYVADRDVLHGIDLDLEPGSVWLSSAPPVRASRRSAACSRASTRRAKAASRWAASGSWICPSTRCARRSPSSRRSSTCSSALSPRTCGSRGRAPRPWRCATRSRQSTRSSGPRDCPTGWRRSSAPAAIR